MSGVLVYGSCVARDTVAHLDPSFSLAGYVARQSAISAGGPPVTLVPPPDLESPFQQRMVDGDFASNLAAVVARAAARTDLVLVDLVDERLGVHLLPDGTAVTRSVELVRSGGEDALPPGTRHVAFGSGEHVRRWSAGMAAVAETLRAQVPHATVVVLDVPWATTAEDGSPTPTSFGAPVDETNRVMRRYARRAADLLGARRVSLPPRAVTSGTRHPWGEAPFHYAEPVYLRLAQLVTGRPGRAVWAAGAAQRPRPATRPSAPAAAPAPAADPPSPRTPMQPPFFVIGAPRSGTSYLVQVLDRHPTILLTNETRVMTFLFRVLTRHSKDKMALMTERALFLATLRKHMPDVVRDFYRELGAVEDTRWGDKFPHYADSRTDPGLLGFIAEMFPRCQFVHITRDGRDVVASLRDKGWADLDEACDVWERHVTAARAVGRKVGPARYHELRYEDLVTDAGATVAGLLRFLRLGPAAEVDRFLAEQEVRRTPFSGATTPADRIGAPGWRDRLSAAEVAAVSERLRRRLALTGYGDDAGGDPRP